MKILNSLNGIWITDNKDYSNGNPFWGFPYPYKIA